MKLLKSLLFCLGVLTLAACKKNDEEILPELIVSTESVSFSNAGESKTIHVKSNVDWTISSSETWLTLSLSGGSGGTHKIELAAAENSQITERQATLTITAGNLTRTVTIVQSAASLFQVEQTELNISSQQQEIQLTVQSNADYEVSFGEAWLSRKAEPVSSGSAFTETLIVKRNGNIFERSSTIIFKKGTETIRIDINQAANPITIPASQSGVASEAAVLASKIKIGWNLGNALEAASSTTSASETLWGNPKTTKALIDAVKSSGFNAVRIPCAWSGYIEDPATYKIKDFWLERVKEVVDYCISNEMYVVLNIHWDGGWLEENPTYSAQESVNKKQKALWQQIAVYFRDYDEHLLFAGTNEVHKDYGVPSTENIAVQESFNQTFVDAVRATGGKNAYRNLVIQSYNTNVQYAVDYLAMPDDEVVGRLMAEVHFYDPWDFAGDESSSKYLWGKDFADSANVSAWGQEDWVEEQFSGIESKFTAKGIPVILGEYGAILRTSTADQANHIKARNNYLTYVTKAAKDHGLVPFYWDNGAIGNNGFGIFDRTSCQVIHQDALTALMNGAN